MRIPAAAPKQQDLLEKLFEAKAFDRITRIYGARVHAEQNGQYLHWDDLRHRKPPEGFSLDDWWLAVKIGRSALFRDLPNLDKRGVPFRYATTDSALEMLHAIDRDASGRIELNEQVTNPNTRDRYIVNSLIEEAITSSQLEGASTTRKVAKEMIRSGRRPKNKSEQMILNNYEAIQFVRGIKGEPFEPSHVLQLHEILTMRTLDEPEKVGRLRTAEDHDVAVYDREDQKLHHPPDYRELEKRLNAMCRFANERRGNEFIHPVVRAIIIHFWLAYDHPFVDGNGRTARALFYWSMLSQGYWLFEFVSISRILRAAPSKYARSFLHSETDENDLTYFILYQLKVITRAINELNTYLREKQTDIRRVESMLRRHAGLNHRQLALLSHALKNPDFGYTIESHRRSHNVVYQTARADLLGLMRIKLLEQARMGRSYVFYPASDISERLRAKRQAGA